MYVTGGDTLFITHESWAGANNIDVYVNGQLHSRLDSVYLRKAARPDRRIYHHGLTAMRTGGVWVEIRNPPRCPSRSSRSRLAH